MNRNINEVKSDPRFLKETGVEVFTGNELLVKGCLETEGGTHLWTGYPGSPVAGFFDTAQELQELLRAKGIRATMANNEALAAAMVNGSQMLGLRAITIQKSVGLHVAADGLALGNLVGAHPEGGAIVVLGDDPWSDSTQVPADSRYLCKHLMMPVLEPSDAQEMKDWINLAFRLSRQSELYIGYLVSTNQADGGGSVDVAANHFPATNVLNPTEIDTAKIDLERNVLLPPRTWRKEQAIETRFRRLWEAARKWGANRIEPPSKPEWTGGTIGFITSAAAYCYLRHALAELRLDGHFPILKMGVTYPVDPAIIGEFAAGLSHVFVVEERRGFLEEQITEILTRFRQEGEKPLVKPNLAIWGKRFPSGLEGIPSSRGLNPSKLIDRLGRLFLSLSELAGSVDRRHVETELQLLVELRQTEIKVAPRTPTFCPGCPHRDSASVLVEIKKQFREEAYMSRIHGTKPVDLVFHGDTGCYTMLMFEPTKDLMHNYSGMGLGGGTGAGIDPFIRNKQVVFMGDSTFFHSGQLAISNSLKCGQDITYVILDNKTTAMTGHQTTPALGEGLLGEETFAQRIDAIVAGVVDSLRSGITVVRVNPAERESYRRLLEKTILLDGVKIIIADKECGITFHRREAREERATLKQQGFLQSKQYINITTEACENCLECTKATGCPGLTFVETPYGQKVQTDLSWCVSDGACTRFMVTPDAAGPRVKACPSFEEVTIVRTQKPAPAIDSLRFDGLPLLPRRLLLRPWHGYLAGVGGMGIGTATAVLVLAGHREGYRVQFCDKKGLAIRNGGVYSMITYSPWDGPYTSNLIPYGKADLILGVDVLEAARALDPATNQRVGSRQRTAVLVNTHKTPTILTLLGKDDFAVRELEESIQALTRRDDYFSANVSALSEVFFQTQLYANTIMLGVAYQRGLLPLSVEALEWAIQAGLGGAAAENLKAFHLGRLLVHDPKAVWAAARMGSEPQGLAEVVEDKVAILARGERKRRVFAEQYRSLMGGVRETFRLEDEELGALALRAYDLVQWGDIEYARQYLDWVRRIHSADHAEHGYAATKAVLWNLHKVMLIKDEIYVAHLLTSEEKRRRDAAKFGLDPSRGDRIVYKHLNRPQLTILGKDVAFDIRTRDWQLDIVKKQRWLRRVLPDWHQEERSFREWYLALLPGFQGVAEDRHRYHQYVRILRLPEQVTGYREIRYPKMEAARQQATVWLQELARAPVLKTYSVV